MFTGIIESTGEVLEVHEKGTNRTFLIRSRLDEPVYEDQSIAHNGACLTVETVSENSDRVQVYTVTAVQETLQKTNLGDIVAGDMLNLERSLRAGARMDGHFVQGHVDATGQLDSVEDLDGSWSMKFSFHDSFSELIVPRGSICVNGISLTVAQCAPGTFEVAVIPYTWDHTNLSRLRVGDRVNLEFDILGKYILNMLRQRAQ